MSMTGYFARPTGCAGTTSVDFGLYWRTPRSCASSPRDPTSARTAKRERKRSAAVTPVSRILSAVARLAAASGETIIPLALASLPGSSNLPGGFGRAVLERLPIWSCSVRGFACHLCCQRRGALLPHLFTIACRPPRTDVSCVFSVPLSVRLPCPGVTRRTALWSSDYPPLRPLHDAVARPRLDRAAIVWPGCGASFLGLSTSDFGLQTPDFGVR